LAPVDLDSARLSVRQPAIWARLVIATLSHLSAMLPVVWNYLGTGPKAM